MSFVSHKKCSVAFVSIDALNPCFYKYGSAQIFIALFLKYSIWDIMLFQRDTMGQIAASSHLTSRQGSFSKWKFIVGGPYWYLPLGRKALQDMPWMQLLFLVILIFYGQVGNLIKRNCRLLNSEEVSN